MDKDILIQCDSSQAEARVVWKLAGDEDALDKVDKIDYHALTATWFFANITYDEIDKKKLGYEHPIRFAGKTLRHAGHLGAKKRRASLEVNTQARKYKIPIHISEEVAETALKIFHQKQPKIQSVFHKGIQDCLGRNRTLIAPVPYGIDAKYGGRRVFYERWGDDLFRQGYSYIPQRAVTDNTKASGLRIIKRIPGIKIVMEAHDALLFAAKESQLEEYSGIIREEFERPIRFDTCSIPRDNLIIPCDVEWGYNYAELKKFKFPFVSKVEVDKCMASRSFIVR